MEIIPYLPIIFWHGEFLNKVEGTLAERMALCIQESPQSYPYIEHYFFTGPNSNTYVQWVLNQFPEFPAQLPWNAFGKDCPKIN